MRKTINDYADELDSVIEKALSYDITRPVEVTSQSQIYNPYMMLPDGSYAPYPVDHWISQTPRDKRPEMVGNRYGGYEEVYDFYDAAGAERSWKKFSKSIPDLIDVEFEFKKAGEPLGGLPIGTIHRWKDGNQYRKEAHGWVPVGAPTHHAQMMEPENQLKASHEIEQHARIHKIEEELKRRKGEKQAGEKKETREKPEKGKIEKPEKKVEAKEEERPDKAKIQPINHEFSKKGAEVDLKTVEKYIDAFEKDFKALVTMGDALRNAGATHFASRLKDRFSLFKKMKGRMKDRALNSVADIIGARGLTDTLEKQQEMLKKISDKYEMVEVEDATQKGFPGSGYRAIHVMFKTKAGLLGELQLKTHRQQIFSGYSHDTLYKGEKAVVESPEVQAYSKAVSDYFYALDQGATEAELERPVAPSILVEKGIDFPWDELKEMGTTKMAEKEGMKYFVVVRDPETKENQKVLEFDSFNKAKRYRRRLQEEMGDKEIPLAYSKSMDEFLDTFSEYRPKNWQEIKAVRKKVQRNIEEKIDEKTGEVTKIGKGKEVKLSRAEIKTVLDSGKYALVSAGRNPAHEQDRNLSDEEVKKRHEELKKELVKGGYSFTPAKGVYGDREDTFLVMAHDIDREEVTKLGKKFNQDSVIYGEGGTQEMHYTVGENAGKVATGAGFKDASKATDFYTDIDGFKFSLNLDMEKLKEAKDLLKSFIQSLLRKGINPDKIREVIEEVKSNWRDHE